MTTAVKRRLSAEEFLNLNLEGPCELVRGEVVTMSPTIRHGKLTVWISYLLTVFLQSNPIGRPLAEVGFLIARDPDTVRVPDVLFLSYDRLSREEEEALIESDEVLAVAPELAVEIRSPDDRWSDVEEKIDEYFQAGVRLIWVVDARRQAVHVYRADGSVRRLGALETLTGEDVLPGFEVPVTELLAGEAARQG